MAAAMIDMPRDLVFGHYLTEQRPQACPEVALWLVHGQVDLNARCEALLNGAYAPYWAFCWGAGQALARYVLDQPERVRGKRVVDFGAGSGGAAIAAALAGAEEVTAVDIDPRARAFCAHNAALNHVAVNVSAEIPAQWDVLLASDVLYEVSVLHQLLLASRGRRMIVADPLRPGNPRLPFDAVVCYRVQCVPDVDYPMKSAAVYDWVGTP
jgi:predicted nicotinamide N-methyase